jgi:hypothetical protein
VVVASDIGPNRELLGTDQVRATEAEAVELLRAVLADRTLAAKLLAEQRRRRSRYGAHGNGGGLATPLRAAGR